LIKGAKANFSSSGCQFQDLITGKTIGNAKQVEGLYLLEDGYNSNRQSQRTCLNSISIPNENKIMLWHFRLGHPSFYYLRHLFPKLFLNKNPASFQCEICELAKHRRTYFPAQPYKPTKPFSVIHSDVWGPSRIKTITGKRWFITFIDDHTRITWVFLLHEKSKAENVFKTFYKMIQTQFQTHIQVFRSDNSKEYFNEILGNFFEQNGIVHQSSCNNTPQQNGVAERKNKHLLEVTRSLTLSNNVPKYLWGEAVLTSTYLINRMPSKILKFQTPLNCFKEHFPSSRLSHDLPLKVFGCTAFVHVHDINRGKLDPRARKCVFVGYPSTQKGYKCFDPISKFFFISMDVTFFEDKPFFCKTHLQGETSSKDS